MEDSAVEAQSSSYTDEARFRTRVGTAMRVHGGLPRMGQSKAHAAAQHSVRPARPLTPLHGSWRLHWGLPGRGPVQGTQPSQVGTICAARSCIHCCPAHCDSLCAAGRRH